MNNRTYYFTNLFLFLIMAYFGYESRFKNILQIDNHAWIEHIIAGLGVPAFFVAFFMTIAYLISIFLNTEIKKTNLFFISSLASIMYLLIAWLSEYNKPNIGNQFSYDVLGIFIYSSLMLLLLKGNVFITKPRSK